jgi:hypothetical protein
MAQLAITSNTYIYDKGEFFLMEGNRRIHIVSFLNFIQVKSQVGAGKAQVAIFDGVGIAKMLSYQTLRR